MTSSEARERLIDTIALLSVPGIGRGRFNKLIARFGSAAAILEASPRDLETVPGISHGLASSIKGETDREAARKLAGRVNDLGWTVLYPDSEGYPRLLGQISEAPPLLFRLGEAATPTDKMIGIVGTRHATERGKRFAQALAAELAQAGIIVVSGMAEGIDSAAHAGALDAGGKTIAVWGTPLDVVYPSINRALAERIKAQGAVYSEYLPGLQQDKGTFPERNRIISGMSEGVVVIEAGEKSGALITAEWALEQGRELFAVPGPPGVMASLGTNGLIKKGARLLTGIQDIFDELPRLTGAVAARRFEALPDLTEKERQMVNLLANGPVQIDHLSRQTCLPVTELLEYLLALELKGLVTELSGKRFMLADQAV